MWGFHCLDLVMPADMRSSFFADNLVLSTGLKMWIGHPKEIRKLTFRGLGLRLCRLFDVRRGGLRDIPKNSNHKIEIPEILLSWCIIAAQKYYLQEFSLQTGSWFCDILRMNFLSFAWRGILMSCHVCWSKKWLTSGILAIWTDLVLEKVLC